MFDDRLHTDGAVRERTRPAHLTRRALRTRVGGGAAALTGAELRPDHPVVACALGAAATVGRPGAAAGMNSWHDAATFTRAGTPTIDIGPAGFDSAHAVAEHVAMDEPMACAQTYALCAMRSTADQSACH